MFSCVWRRVVLRSLGSSLTRLYSTSIAPSVVLRPYQEQCLQACLGALNSGSTRIGVSLPTGSGKTTVFISLLSQIPTPETNPHAQRALIIVSSVELARQSAAQVARMFPHWTVEIDQGVKYKASGLADVTVATYQTLRNPERLAKIDPHKLKAIIVDEAHHAAASSYRRILSHFDSDIKFNDADRDVTHPHRIPIVGFSATFSRHDGLALGSIFEQIVYHRDFLDMIQEQWLCDVRFTSVQAKFNLNEVAVNSRNGDFVPSSLAKVISTKEVNDLVVKAWIDRASDRKSTLVFCVTVDHVQALTQTFREYGIDARYLFSETPAAERKALVDAFKAGTFPVLVNCSILTEGADIPNIDCVVVARPTRSRNVFSQMIGRGMRLSPNSGKIDCRIIDFVDSQARVDGVICTPTLFGLNPNKVQVDDETPASLSEKASRLSRDDTLPESPSMHANLVSITYEDQDDPFTFKTAESSPPGHISGLSPFAWVDCGGDIYALELLGSGFIRIEPSEDDDDQYVARYVGVVKGGSQKVYQRPKDIAEAEDLSTIVRACDTYVTQNLFKGWSSKALLRTAAWRATDASDSQKDMLSKRWLKQKSQLTPQEKLDKVACLTKGDAANILCRLRHGYQGRYNDRAKKAQKILAAFTKESQRKLREVVQLGYLI